MTEVLSPDELREELKGQPESVLDGVRDMAKNNIFFCAKGVLGYRDVNQRTHSELCRFLDNEPAIRRLTLMPRGTLKTTLATITGSVQDILKDPIENRTLICHEVADTAAAMMEEVKAHFTVNPNEYGKGSSILTLLFPDMYVSRTSGPGVVWNTEQATVPTPGRIHKDPHLMPAGVGSSVTGRHFTRIRPDDLIGFDAKESQAVMEYTVRWAKNLTALLENPSSHLIDFVGTRWLTFDLYHAIMEHFGELLAVFNQGPWHPDGDTIFPQRITKAFLDHLRQTDPDQYYSQYENNPLTGGRRDLVKPKPYTIEDGYVVYEHKGQRRRCHLDYLDRVMVADPAGDKTFSKTARRNKSDLAAIVVLGMSWDGCLFVLSSESRRYNPTEFVDRIHEVAKQWRPRIIGIEQVALATTLHYFNLKMEETKTYWPTEPLSPKNTNKTDRMRQRLQPMLAMGRLYVPEHARVLRSQIDFFPGIKEDGELDCTAYFEDLVRTPSRPEPEEETEEMIRKLLADRNPYTGY